MSRRQRTWVALGLICAAVACAIAFFAIRGQYAGARAPLVLTGSVLKDNGDPTRQAPLAGAMVTATVNGLTISAKSNEVGYFSLPIGKNVSRGEPIQLQFQHPDYKPLEMIATKPGDQLYIARLEPLPKKEAMAAHNDLPAKTVVIKNIQVRYSYKDETTIGVGSLAKQFSAPNGGNVPCRSQVPCSPDGRWKATETTLPLDAGEGNAFRNVRVSCIAGPCAFSKLESGSFGEEERKIQVSVLNWSDTVDYLVEADVARTMVTDQVRQIYPFLLEQTMNFALPPSSEGPTIEADYAGQYIIFPLGPELRLTWADCTVEVSPDKNKIYRCQLKPGYQFGS